MRRPTCGRLALLLPLLALGACASDLLLGPDAAQGIDGLVLLGPLCPVVTDEDPCPDRPYATKIDVRDGGGATVTTVHSGDDGRFRVGLAPGRYRLVPASSASPLPRAGSMDVDVPAGAWVEVTVDFDTGIR